MGITELEEQPKKWQRIGAGNYNRVFRSEDRKLVLKVQLNASDTDSPERSVRLWNLINSHLQPPATIIESEHGLGWVCPFVEGERASDNDIPDALIDIYNKSGRIILDAVADNFVKTPDGKVVCIDIGMALRLDNEEQKRLLPKPDAPSIISDEAWKKYQRVYQGYFERNQIDYPQSIQMVKALLFIREHRPDMDDVSFLKGQPEKVALLAQAYDEKQTNTMKDKGKYNFRVLDREIKLLNGEVQNYTKEAKDMLREIKSPSLDAIKESCVKELERYINARGSVNYEGKFSPSLMTKIFRDKGLTEHKVQVAQDLMSQIRGAGSLQEIQDLVQTTYQNDRKLSQKTFYSGFENSLGKCVAMAVAAQKDDYNLGQEEKAQKAL